MIKVIATSLVMAGVAIAQVTVQPAARVHVRMINGNAVKFTSKLTQVVELNFTMGNGHQPGKIVIRDGLDRIAKNYGGFTIHHISSTLDGSQKGVIPAFSLTDLTSADVIVANNISYFGDPALGTAKQQAIQQAVETEGKGYLGFHGSGDNKLTGWPWYTNTLHPMNYGGHGSRTTGPVYKHLDEITHIVLQNILNSKTTVAKDVPNEIDATGKEILAPNVPVRMMKNEWYRFGRDISRDATYKDKVTILLKYDPRQLPVDALPDAYPPRRKGGNLYTYLYKVGKGMTSYIPAGHENDELLDPTTGFDGGAGDYDRYVAQTLFYLAGYKQGVCDASCKGLDLVNDKDQIIGKYDATVVQNHGVLKRDVYFDPVKMAFSSPFENKAYEAKVTDMTGHVVYSKSGKGVTYQEFDGSHLKAGVYFLSVKIGNAAAQVKRYAMFNSPV